MWNKYVKRQLKTEVKLFVINHQCVVMPDSPVAHGENRTDAEVVVAVCSLLSDTDSVIDTADSHRRDFNKKCTGP